MLLRIDLLFYRPMFPCTILMAVASQVDAIFVIVGFAWAAMVRLSWGVFVLFCFV